MNPDHPPRVSDSPSHANLLIMQVGSAFVSARCLYAVAELGVADHLGDEPRSTEELAKSTNSNPDALYRVLRQLASLGIFTWKDGKWQHNEASRFLRSDHPGSLRDYIRMNGARDFWDAWGEVLHTLRTGESAFKKLHPGGVFEYLATQPELSDIFNAAMTSKSHRDIAAILPAYDFSQFATIADIAGGRGHLLRAILKKSQTSQGILFDQPHVVSGIKPEAGEKLTVVGGNFFTDSMPKADAYLLMNIIHDWPDAESIKILSGIRRAMPPNGRVLVLESVVPSTPGPHLSKELDIVMMVLPGGRERTQDEYAALAEKSGLRLQRSITTMSPYSILEMVAA